MRLDGYLKQAGLTRRRAKEAIAAGRVLVDGVPARDPALKIGMEPVTLDGEAVGASKKRHVMLNKPAGYVTAHEDKHYPVVMALLPKALRDLGPIGRLDRDVEGLLILTDDGQLAHRLISPKRGVKKIYGACVKGRLTQDDIQKMARGIPLKDFTCMPAELSIISAEDEHSTAELAVHEGKYHQVKRMFAATGHPVISLKRKSIGDVTLDPALSVGEYRMLREDEASALYALVGLDEES